mgnify:FL=1|tara:strand:- start:9 stop:266 length:258 start_codon:yes stop_codon:yes gene_type:complete
MNLCKNPKCIFKFVDNTGVILEPENGKFIELNETASFIWNLLDEEETYEGIYSKTKEKFNVTTDVERQINEFLKTAIKANIVQEI